MALPPVLLDLVKALEAFLSIKQVILYGSRARGDHGERSDIDLAVSGPEISPAEWQQIQEIIENARTLLKIEVVRLESAPQELRQNILKEGQILYERNG